MFSLKLEFFCLLLKKRAGLLVKPWNVFFGFIYVNNLMQAFNGKKWEKFNSEKVASLAYARIQGKGALVAHFQNSSFMNEDKRCRPILFHSGSPDGGDQVALVSVILAVV